MMHRVTLWIAIVTLTLGSIASAQNRPADRNSYVAAGAPANPKVTTAWNRYYDHAQATELLQRIAAAHPDRMKLTSLGKSHGGRDIWLVTLSDFATGDPAAKPAFWIDGGIHANELQGSEACLYTIWYLTEMAGQNEFISRLLQQRTLFIVPIMNPDGRDAHMHAPATTHSPRGSMRPFDSDRDGLTDEDGDDDLDGDGHITQMRVLDPHGAFKPHARYPQIMVRIEAGETYDGPRYTLLGSENIDNDGDGDRGEDPLGGADPNRDWPGYWQPMYAQRGAAFYPLWSIENRLVARFIVDHPRIAGAQSYHNAGGMILRGPAIKSARLVGNDQRTFDHIAKVGEKILPGYSYLHVAEELYEGTGMELDWFYLSRGTIAFTNEMFTAFNFFRQKVEGGFFGPEEDHHAFNRFLLLGDGIVKWHPVIHPELGPIEVGGLKKNWLRQPPAFLLEEELHRNMAFTLYHADQGPLVRIHHATAKQVGPDLWQVTAIVGNQRLTPTRLAVDVQHKITRPDLASLTAADGKVVAGFVSDDAWFEGAREQEHEPGVLRIEAIGPEDVVYVRWLVAGRGPFTVTIDSIKGGRDSMGVVAGP